VGLKPRLLNPRSTFVAVHARLIFTSPEDERAVLDLMRRFSAAYRWIYKRLLEGHDPNELKREGGPMERRFGLNVKYNEGARDLALWKIAAMKELDRPPEKVVFGGRSLFRRLGERMGGERNEYKLNRLKAEKEELEKALGYLKKFLSLQGSSGGPEREVTARRNPEEPKGAGLPLWRALQVGVLRPLLGQKVPRDLSALKPLLVGGAWNGGGGASLGPVRYAGPARMGGTG
jgi:predicted transposase